MAEAKTTQSKNTKEKFTAFEMPESLTNMAEMGVQKARESYAAYKDLAGDSTEMLETTFDAMTRNTAEINKTSLKAAKDSINSGFDHIEALLSAKNPTDIFELQSQFARKQFEMLTEQAKAMQTLFGKAAEEVSSPIKETLTRAQEQAKAAF